MGSGYSKQRQEPMDCEEDTAHRQHNGGSGRQGGDPNASWEGFEDEKHALSGYTRGPGDGYGNPSGKSVDQKAGSDLGTRQGKQPEVDRTTKPERGNSCDTCNGKEGYGSTTKQDVRDAYGKTGANDDLKYNDGNHHRAAVFEGNVNNEWMDKQQELFQPNYPNHQHGQGQQYDQQSWNSRGQPADNGSRHRHRGHEYDPEQEQREAYYRWEQQQRQAQLQQQRSAEGMAFEVQ